MTPKLSKQYRLLTLFTLFTSISMLGCAQDQEPTQERHASFEPVLEMHDLMASVLT